VSPSFRGSLAQLSSREAVVDREPSRAGVTIVPGPKYWARVRKESLGRFDSAEQAARAYDKRARQLGYPADRLNFPDGDKGKGPRDRRGHDDSFEPDGMSSQTQWRSV
jgi:hypothetical protein